MPEENETSQPDKHCATCVHWRPGRILGHCASEQRAGPTSEIGEFGPHDCDDWAASDAHRQAEALEGIELALMLVSGLWAPEDEEPETVEWECTCGARLAESTDVESTACPACGAEYTRHPTGLFQSGGHG